MPRTPDDFPGERLEDSILFESGSFVPSNNGEVAYVTSSGFAFYEENRLRGLGLFTGSVSSPGEDFRQVAFIENVGPFEGWPSNYSEITGGSLPFPLTQSWYTDNTKTKLIMRKTVTRNAQQNPITTSWVLYKTDGTTTLRTFTDVITYNGVFETSRSRTQTP